MTDILNNIEFKYREGGQEQPLKGDHAPAQRRNLLYFNRARKEEQMEQIFELVGQYAFPIVMCLVMAWFVKYQSDNNRADMNELQKQHREEMGQVTTALNNNTLALQHLSDLLADNGREKDI